mmetsp:Transcript_36576/g.102719  ORF Transcript_36576/g.102719 Transcript_36576/m.102719 type:complete len:319 (-) Transcript_36576:1117-2073(-)
MGAVRWRLLADVDLHWLRHGLHAHRAHRLPFGRGLRGAREQVLAERDEGDSHYVHGAKSFRTRCGRHPFKFHRLSGGSRRPDSDDGKQRCLHHHAMGLRDFRAAAGWTAWYTAADENHQQLEHRPRWERRGAPRAGTLGFRLPGRDATGARPAHGWCSGRGLRHGDDLRRSHWRRPLHVRGDHRLLVAFAAHFPCVRRHHDLQLALALPDQPDTRRGGEAFCPVGLQQLSGRVALGGRPLLRDLVRGARPFQRAPHAAGAQVWGDQAADARLGAAALEHHRAFLVAQLAHLEDGRGCSIRNCHGPDILFLFFHGKVQP